MILLAECIFPSFSLTLPPFFFDLTEDKNCSSILPFNLHKIEDFPSSYNRSVHSDSQQKKWLAQFIINFLQLSIGNTKQWYRFQLSLCSLLFALASRFCRPFWAWNFLLRLHRLLNRKIVPTTGDRCSQENKIRWLTSPTLMKKVACVTTTICLLEWREVTALVWNCAHRVAALLQTVKTILFCRLDRDLLNMREHAENESSVIS